MNILAKFTATLFVTTLTIVSCESDEPLQQSPGSGKLSQSAQEFLTIQQSLASIAAHNGLGTLDRSSLKRSFSSLSGRNANDSVSCGETTVRYNPDGSVTTTVDYGDGCDEGGQFLYGFHETTFKSSTTYDGVVMINSFYAHHKFKNFGGRYMDSGQQVEWMNDGTSTDEGSTRTDTLTNAVSGVFEHSAHITSVFAGQAFFHKGSSRTVYDTEQSVVESSDFTYTTNGENYFRVKVIEPLVSRTDCPAAPGTWMPPIISGIQSVHFKNADGHGFFENHYGNGECDAIVTVIEKGKKTNVNL